MQQNLKTCSNCGQETLASSKFCPSCGIKFLIHAPTIAFRPPIKNQPQNEAEAKRNERFEVD